MQCEDLPHVGVGREQGLGEEGREGRGPSTWGPKQKADRQGGAGGQTVSAESRQVEDSLGHQALMEKGSRDGNFSIC